MVGQVNNQTHALGHAHEWKRVCMISKGRFIRRKTNLTHVGDLPKKPTTRGKIKPLNFQRVGPENGQPRVKRLWHFVMLFGT